MLSIKTDIPDNLSSFAKEFAGRCKDNKEMMEAIGVASEMVLRKHFANLNKLPNKRGFKKTGYWSKIETATSFTSATGTDAVVTIQDDTFEAKVYGAIITPKRVKALAIPLTEESYGKAPSNWDTPDLFIFVKRKGKAPLLATTRADGSLKPQYVLLKRVKIAPDKNALPKESQMWTSVFEEISNNLNF